MDKTEIQKLLDGQRNFFLTGKTLPIAYRKEALKKLYKAVRIMKPSLPMRFIPIWERADRKAICAKSGL